MPGYGNFVPSRDIPDLSGKVILVTGGTTGLGEGCVREFAAHNPSHIYFTGRNETAAKTLISDICMKHPTASISFIKMDLTSLRAVKEAARGFQHGRLDILMNNAGIASNPPVLSTDGYEIQFATNHLGHAMLFQQLLPVLLKTAQEPGSDVRIINNTSEAYAFHRLIKGGISFSELDAGSPMSRTVLGPWARYGQSKLANMLFTTECARRYPQITSVSIHPGLVRTAMTTSSMSRSKQLFLGATARLTGEKWIEPDEGVLNQLWASAGAKKGELKNGGFYKPGGIESTQVLTAEAKDEALARRLWEWTDKVLQKF
ncbi:short-chain dehydrogenase reductase family [Stemphylium lycopersici]|nr:short-chain dehydrogenase reductase family [Stemphylium lycopersici]